MHFSNTSVASTANKPLIGKTLLYNFHDCSFNDVCIMYEICLLAVGFNKKYSRLESNNDFLQDEWWDRKTDKWTIRLTYGQRDAQTDRQTVQWPTWLGEVGKDVQCQLQYRRVLPPTLLDHTKHGGNGVLFPQVGGIHTCNKPSNTINY